MIGENIPGSIVNFNQRFDLKLASHASIEAQCAAVADDIAYNSHDIDDGLRAGLFTLEEIAVLPIAGETMAQVQKDFPGLDKRRTRHEIVRHQITAMVEDVISNTMQGLTRLSPGSSDDVRKCGETIVCFSQGMKQKERAIKEFLFDRMYRAPQVMAMRDGAEKIISDLFYAYSQSAASIPDNLDRYLQSKQETSRMRTIADFVASMTDSYAINEHQRLFDDTPDLG